jgi:hypothetical protein
MERIQSSSRSEARKNPFANAREFKAATDFPGQKSTVISILKEAGLTARHAAVKAVLTNEHQLCRLEFAESSMDRQLDSHILCRIYI